MISASSAGVKASPASALRSIRSARLPSPSHLTPKEDDLTNFLTPDAGTPEGVSQQTSGPHESSAEAANTEHPYSSVEELYVDAAQKTPVSRRTAGDATLEHEEGAEDRPLSGASNSPSPPKFMSHVDWNWPPAFPAGRLASRAGHLQSPGTHEVVEISDDEAESPAMTIASLPVDRSEALSADATEASQETPSLLSDVRNESFGTQLPEFTLSNGDTSGGQSLRVISQWPTLTHIVLVTSQYNDEPSAEDLYADLDAFIDSGEQQEEMSTEEADAFIRDFLAGPSSVGLDMTESSADVAIETLVETAISSEEDREGQSGATEATPAEVASNEADQATTAEMVEYEVEEPVTEGRRTVVRARVSSPYLLMSYEDYRNQTMDELPVQASMPRNCPTAKTTPFSWS